MKKIYLATILFFVSFQMKAQIHFGLGLGFEQIKSNHQQIEFEYIDESPSRDNIYSAFSILEKYNPITISPSLSYTKGSTEIDLQVKLGLESEFRSIGTYFGYYREIKKMGTGVLSLGGQLGLGGAKLYLGDIYQNSVYIQINGNKYYEEFLGVSYREQQLCVKPLLKYSKPLKDKIRFDLQAGYQYPLMAYNGKILFKGENPNSESGVFEESVSLRSRSLAFYADGMPKKSRLFNQQGVFASAVIRFELK